MGALPSQKYDIVLESFREYLQYYGLEFGKYKIHDKIIIRKFLHECDKGNWEI